MGQLASRHLYCLALDADCGRYSSLNFLSPAFPGSTAQTHLARAHVHGSDSAVTQAISGLSTTFLSLLLPTKHPQRLWLGDYRTGTCKGESKGSFWPLQVLEQSKSGSGYAAKTGAGIYYLQTLKISAFAPFQLL